MSQIITPIRPPTLARTWTRFQNSLIMEEDPMAPPSYSETYPQSNIKKDPWQEWDDYYGPEEDPVERQFNEMLDKYFRDALDLAYIMK